MGEGDSRRPRKVSREEYEHRWAQTFGEEAPEESPKKVGEWAGFELWTDHDMPPGQLDLVVRGRVVGSVRGILVLQRTRSHRTQTEDNCDAESDGDSGGNYPYVV